MLGFFLNYESRYFCFFIIFRDYFLTKDTLKIKLQFEIKFKVMALVLYDLNLNSNENLTLSMFFVKKL
jgi:hypothetical protein